MDALGELELSGWRAFFELYPFDDRHRFHRPAAVIASAFGGTLEQVLNYLSPDPAKPERSDADRDVARALGF